MDWTATLRSLKSAIMRTCLAMRPIPACLHVIPTGVLAKPGKERNLYRYNLVGLPYEMVINSNPCLAYLMKENTLALQVLTIAHVFGHNDF